MSAMSGSCRSSSATTATGSATSDVIRLDSASCAPGHTRWSPAARRSPAAGQLGVSQDRRQRGAQFVAGVGQELPHPPIGGGQVLNAPSTLASKAIQRVPDDAHLVAGVGVGLGDPRGDAMLLARKRKRGSLASHLNGLTQGRSA